MVWIVLDACKADVGLNKSIETVDDGKKTEDDGFWPGKVNVMI